jgi:hypothetical protein
MKMNAQMEKRMKKSDASNFKYTTIHHHWHSACCWEPATRPALGGEAKSKQTNKQTNGRLSVLSFV